jgi:hypothetical protein
LITGDYTHDATTEIAFRLDQEICTLAYNEAAEVQRCQVGPRIEPDWEVFDRLCEVQCTLAEIAAHFGVSEDTIERAVKREHSVSFADYFGEKRKAGFVSLRRRQGKHESLSRRGFL